jgi:hypothetical protein
MTPLAKQVLENEHRRERGAHQARWLATGRGGDKRIAATRKRLIAEYRRVTRGRMNVKAKEALAAKVATEGREAVKAALEVKLDALRRTYPFLRATAARETRSLMGCSIGDQVLQAVF